MTEAVRANGNHVRTQALPEQAHGKRVTVEVLPLEPREADIRVGLAIAKVRDAVADSEVAVVATVATVVEEAGEAGEVAAATLISQREEKPQPHLRNPRLPQIRFEKRRIKVSGDEDDAGDNG